MCIYYEDYPCVNHRDLPQVSTIVSCFLCGPQMTVPCPDHRDLLQMFVGITGTCYNSRLSSIWTAGDCPLCEPQRYAGSIFNKELFFVCSPQGLNTSGVLQ
ncbi:hypothetical protein ACF0H5_010335 [Mactra antiquata]